MTFGLPNPLLPSTATVSPAIERLLVMPPQQTTVIPDFLYRTSVHGTLAGFIHRIHNTELQLATYVKVIVLDADYDGLNSSLVLDLLYSRDWSGDNDLKDGRGNELQSTLDDDEEMDEAEGAESMDVEADIPESKGYADHIFTILREDLFLATFEDSVDEVRMTLQASPHLYIKTITELLKVCINLEVLFVPRAWIHYVDTRGWKNLRFVRITEDIGRYGGGH